MRLDDDDLDEMVSKGRKVNGYEKPAPKEDEGHKILAAIKKQIDYLISRPTEPITVSAPDVKPVVNVPAPVVTVNPQKPITKWKFTLKKDKQGNTTEIIAEAL